ncbi:MAG: hypothetical protein OXI23_05265 [Gemmatimonadota bacterium]|nr:hypothetical protein [Gemmatimonadota bacterium]
MVCKNLFFVQSVTKLVNDNEKIELNACYDTSDPEIKSFSDATPQGLMEITISNPNLYGKFKPRQKYYTTLEEQAEE